MAQRMGALLRLERRAEHLTASDVTGHVIVDGGLLSNFPITLFLADRADVAAVVGPVHDKNVLGLLIDETIPVPKHAQRLGQEQQLHRGAAHLQPPAPVDEHGHPGTR